MSNTQQMKQAFEGWFLAQVLKGQAVWLHSVYRAVLPQAIYDKVAKGDFKLGTEYARSQGYSIHKYPGSTEIRKNGLVVAQFIPRLVGEREDAHLEFTATVLDQNIDVLALMKDTTLEI